MRGRNSIDKLIKATADFLKGPLLDHLLELLAAPFELKRHVHKANLASLCAGRGLEERDVVVLVAERQECRRPIERAVADQLHPDHIAVENLGPLDIRDR